MKLIGKPKKSLGQNFLIDKNIINKITKIADIDNTKTIMEIGAGYGSLTSEITNKNPKKFFVVEKDKKLSVFLKEKFKDFNNVRIINDDILNVFEKRFSERNLIVFGNLPYNVSTKILVSLIMIKKWPPWFDFLVLMFQKEVADRILAKKDTKDFNRLSVLSNWRLEIKKHFDISKNCFFPRPKIDSTLLSFRPKINNLFHLKNPKNLEKITRILFSNKRKMINKNFKKLFGKNTLLDKNLNIDLSKRPEEISSELYYKIAINYEKLFD